jgi:hypothetical protein
MRRGVWFVLVLMVGAPAGALAQQQQQPAAPMEDTAGTIIVEQSAPGEQRTSTMATQENKQAWSCAAIGGSGGAPRPRASTAPSDEEQIFVGRLRSVTLDRLVMVGPSHRVYEFDVGARTRLIGPTGKPASPWALKVGMPVRAVTREAEVRNQVLALQILGPAPTR